MNLDLYNVLIKDNDPDKVVVFNNKKLHWDWKKELKESSINLNSAILIFVGFDGKILNICSTECIKYYLGNVKNNMVINNIYAVLEHPNNLILKTKRYIELFNIKKNKYCSNGKKINRDDKYIILPANKKETVEWLKQNPRASYFEFILKFNRSELYSLCVYFNCKEHTLLDLEEALIKNKKPIKYEPW